MIPAWLAIVLVIAAFVGGFGFAIVYAWFVLDYTGKIDKVQEGDYDSYES